MFQQKHRFLDSQSVVEGVSDSARRHTHESDQSGDLRSFQTISDPSSGFPNTHLLFVPSELFGVARKLFCVSGPFARRRPLCSVSPSESVLLFVTRPDELHPLQSVAWGPDAVTISRGICGQHLSP